MPGSPVTARSKLALKPWGSLSTLFSRSRPAKIHPLYRSSKSLAFYLDVPLEQFWGNQTLSEQANADPVEQPGQFTELRQKIIGTRIRLARSNLNLSIQELCQKTSIPEELIRKYELGELPIPLPELEILANALQVRMEELFDQRGPIGQWRQEQLAVNRFLELPNDVREFVCKPVNLPYLRLAMRLSDLSVEKLRGVAEGLLEITY